MKNIDDVRKLKRFDSQCFEVDGITGGKCCFCGTDIEPGYGFSTDPVVCDGETICCEECEDEFVAPFSRDEHGEFLD